jgi:COP9 signalosome complex subunit 4
MGSSSLAEALEAARAKPAQDKAAAYESIISDVQSSSATATSSDIIALFDSIFAASLGIVPIRALVDSLLELLSNLPDNEDKIEAANHALNILSSQEASFEEQSANLRFILGTTYENESDFLAAAKVLASIPVDSSQRKHDNYQKVKLWIRITRNYLEVDDTTSAEIYLNKAKNLMYQVPDKEQNLLFKLSQARIQDSRRDFLNAAQGYQDISLMLIIAEEERSHILSMAIKCGVLAPAGPARSKILAKLYKDERAASLEEFAILEKMFLDRLLAPEEVEKFAEGLLPHQLARTADGSTVLAKAVVEHNLLAASRLYSNIGFDDLGVLLGLDGDKAEETTARMIEQGRLVGSMDQIDRIIWFEGGEATGEKGSGRAERVLRRELRRWDANVQGLTEEVEKVASALQAHYPVSFTTEYTSHVSGVLI